MRQQVTALEERSSELKNEKLELEYRVTLNEKETHMKVDQLEHDLKASKEVKHSYFLLLLTSYRNFSWC